MEATFKTGLPLLDDHLAGLIRGKAYVVLGEAGTGKTLLGLQYLICGTLRQEAGLYATQERPADLIAQTESIGLHVAPAVRRGDLILMEYDQDITQRIARYGWKPLLDHLGRFRKEAEIRRVVFDTIHPLFAATIEEGRLRYDLRYCVETLEEWGWTSLFLNDRATTQGHPSLYRVLSDVCSGVFELQDEVENLESSKHLFIHKLRQPSDRMRRIPFVIVPGVGLVETAPSPKNKGADPGGAIPIEEDTIPPLRPRVLLADDDPFVRSVLKRGLKDEFDILMTDDGIGALTLALKERPDAILLDVVLPRISGFEVCRSLRASGYNRAILFVSSLEDPLDRVRGISLGGNDFIQKPFHMEEVRAKVRTAVRIRLSLDSTTFDQSDLGTLLDAARARSLGWGLFRQKLEEAGHHVDEFRSPMGIVCFRWQLNGRTEETAGVMRERLEAAIRPEDFLSLPNPGEAFVALPAEDRDGTLAFLRKLSVMWSEDGTDGSEEMPRQIEVSFHVVIAGEENSSDAMLQRAGREFRDLFEDPLFRGHDEGRAPDALAASAGE